MCPIRDRASHNWIQTVNLQRVPSDKPRTPNLLQHSGGLERLWRDGGRRVVLEERRHLRKMASMSRFVRDGEEGRTSRSGHVKGNKLTG